MGLGSIQWLLDSKMPHGGYHTVDALHADELTRLPGPVGLREASSIGRALVTCAQEFRGTWEVGVDHPGVVILEHVPVDHTEVERNLQHLEFHLAKAGGPASISGSRFVLRTDRCLLQVLPDGREVDIESWRQVRLATASA